jgi:hypothetical protein
MTDRKDEFLYRWPGGRHLMNLFELEKRMAQIIGDRIVSDGAAMDKIMVEVYDAHILRRNSAESATLGKMSVASAVQKFQ